MLTLEVRNEIAIKHGYKDFNDFWWNGDFTLDHLEEFMLLYGSRCVIERAKKDVEMIIRTKD